METSDKIKQVKSRINSCIGLVRKAEAAMEELDEQLKALGKLGAKPLTDFEQACLDEAALFLGHKLNDKP